MAQSEENEEFQQISQLFIQNIILVKKTTRGHGKQENHKKINFCHFQKCDLRTGFKRSQLTREGPDAPLDVKSAISTILSEISLNSLKLAKFHYFGRKSRPSAPLPQNLTMHKVLIGVWGAFSCKFSVI